MDWQAILIAIITSGIITTVINFYFEKLRNDREVQNQKNLRGFEDKLAIYRLVIDLIADFLCDFFTSLETGVALPKEKLADFDKMRMRTFGYLCIYAEQESIDAHEHLIDYIYEVYEGKKNGEWPEVRDRALRLLNSFRIDYDPKLIPASYNGNR